MSETSTSINTGVIRWSYLWALQPKPSEDGKPPKYTGMFIVPKSDTKTIKLIEDAMQAAYTKGKALLGGKTDKMPTSLKKPLRDGDEERPDDPACKGCMFFNASSENKPGIVGTKKVNGVLVTLSDPEEIYSGAWGRVALNFFAFKTDTSKGIAAGLNGLQKVRDDDRLDGRVAAEVVFDDGTEFSDDDLGAGEDDDDLSDLM